MGARRGVLYLDIYRLTNQGKLAHTGLSNAIRGRQVHWRRSFGVMASRRRAIVEACSRARGETGPDSDYDILLIVPDDAPPERRRARLAYEVLRGTGVAADVLVWTRRAFEERLGVATSLPATVVREGRVVLGE